MFDIIGGTSTGGILATALGVRKAPLLEAEEIYRFVWSWAACQPYATPQNLQTSVLLCNL